MNILLTGAAGYIGNHCTLKLSLLGHSLVGLDFFKPKDTSIFQRFYVGDHGNMAFIQSIFKEERIECILHASGSSNIMETIADPIKYYGNDLMGTIFLLRTALENNVKKIIFLSSAQVYGNIPSSMATENTPPNPINPLGKIKLAIEQLIESLTSSHDLHAVVLRISNVIGMDPNGTVFPQNDDLLSLILFDDSVDIFGNNNVTADHTPERDFIHVNDVAYAIISALPKLNYPPKYSIYNISSGHTYSVKNMIEIAKNILHENIDVKQKKHRTGEIERLAIDPNLARRELGWYLQYPQLEYMIESSASWLRNHGEL
ncbi:MAG: NAD-dependent epimerase/dehydratase family protein [Puniceicoccales bacterium]|nr:NAD-dependent epimerase/dehydratase family protein [Puniceicoccales bacterium]